MPQPFPPRAKGEIGTFAWPLRLLKHRLVGGLAVAALPLLHVQLLGLLSLDLGLIMYSMIGHDVIQSHITMSLTSYGNMT